MRLSLAVDGLFARDRFERWRAEKKKQLRQAMLKAYASEGAVMKERLRANMRAAFAIKKAAFVNVMTTKVWAQRPDRLPDLQVGALRAPWLAAHEVGATIKGPLLIPLNLDRRIGKKTFRKIVTELMRAHNAYFRQVNGRVILFAENFSEQAGLIGKFRRGQRKATGKRVKAGDDVAIAVLVPQVQLQRRLAIQRTVRAHLPVLARAIERNMNLQG
jgi:Family of unknown function (DUF6441)